MSDQQFDAAYFKQNPAEFIERCIINPDTGLPYQLFDAEKQFIKYMFQLERRRPQCSRRSIVLGPDEDRQD
jgi:hypothetical protein